MGIPTSLLSALLALLLASPTAPPPPHPPVFRELRIGDVIEFEVK